MKGIKRSEDTIKKMSRAKKKENLSSETRKKKSESAKGENNSQVKLNWNIIQEVRKLHQTGNFPLIKLIEEIKNKYNIFVSHGCVQAIIENRSWIDLNYKYKNRKYWKSQNV